MSLSSNSTFNPSNLVVTKFTLIYGENSCRQIMLFYPRLTHYWILGLSNHVISLFILNSVSKHYL